MSIENDIASDGRPIRLILDRSFFHDAFRTDYPNTESAKWIFSYLVNRRAVSRQKICITSSVIINNFAFRLKSFPGVPPQTILAILAITEVYPLPQEDMQFDHSTLYVAKILYDNQGIPIILSSVSMEKWRTRAVKAGIEMGLEFDEDMSVKRVYDNIWFLPMNSVLCISLFKKFDPLYSQIIDMVGDPPEQEST